MTSDSALRRYFRHWSVSGHGADRRECAGCNLVTPRSSAAAGAAAPVAWRCWRRCAGPRRGRAGAPPSDGLAPLEIDVGERLPVPVPDGEAGVGLSVVQGGAPVGSGGRMHHRPRQRRRGALYGRLSFTRSSSPPRPRAPSSLQRPTQVPFVVRVSDYSMIWSALNSSDVGIVRPSALAVLRLITNSNLTGSSTGRALGSAPLRILPTYSPARRERSGMSGP